jgi:hypothetical protein
MIGAIHHASGLCQLLPFYGFDAPLAESSVQTRRRASGKHGLESLEDRTAPAVFHVTTLADTVEAARDGSGRDADGNISLRSAIMATNDAGGSNTISLPAGTYLLTLGPDGMNDDASGDLNIGRGLVQNNLTIAGDSAATTIIDGNKLDRILDLGFFCTATVSNLTFRNGKGIFGGAISNSGHATLTSDIIMNNVATHGAGVFSGGTLMMSDCSIEGNTADQGGGIHNSGTMTVTDSSVAGNMASQGGGVLNSGQLTMMRTAVWGNTTTAVVGQGGGLLNQNAMTLTNDTIAGNTASQGGGVFTFGRGPATFVNCTIAGNTASGAFFSSGGGIHRDIGNPVITLKNTIVARNTSDSGPDIDGAVSSMGHNLIGIATDLNGVSNSDLGGTSEQPLDPVLGPLQENGGPTLTLALLPGSPAIDAGDNTDAPQFDQRGPGFSRIVGSTIDIGAFEVQPGAATHFQFNAPAAITSNTPFDITIIALDAYGHIASGYLGTVTFSTSDTEPEAILPADYTFTADEQGVHTFVGGLTLIAVGDEILTVTDASDSSIVGTAQVTVDPGPAAPPRRHASGPSTSGTLSPAGLASDALFWSRQERSRSCLNVQRVDEHDSL